MLLPLFLAQFVEGYLFQDLKVMAMTSPPGPMGHLGYPMLLSAAAGTEMLGILVSTSPFKAEDPRRNFGRYWEQYLYPQSPRRDAGPAVYQLVRHGIAHNFAAKAPFLITKGEPNHLVRDGNETLIDAVQLSEDLIESYRLRFHPVATGKIAGLHGETAATMQLRLNEVIASNGQKMLSHSGSLKGLPLAAPLVPSQRQVTLAGSPTGSLGPLRTNASSSSLK
jgi:hypothetical protein